jgi:hypothetical protein
VACDRLGRRLDHLRTRIPVGCPVCRDWPLVWIMNEGDAEPPERCLQCGRMRTGLVRVYLVGVDVADI